MQKPARNGIARPVAAKLLASWSANNTPFSQTSSTPGRTAFEAGCATHGYAQGAQPTAAGDGGVTVPVELATQLARTMATAAIDNAGPNFLSNVDAPDRAMNRSIISPTDCRRDCACLRILQQCLRCGTVSACRVLASSAAKIVSDSKAARQKALRLAAFHSWRFGNLIHPRLASLLLVGIGISQSRK